MTDERRGLWYRALIDGTVQVRAGREGDDEIAIIKGAEAGELAKCLSRVARISKSPQPHAKFSDLGKSREILLARRCKLSDKALPEAGRNSTPTP